MTIYQEEMQRKAQRYGIVTEFNIEIIERIITWIFEF